MRGHRCGVHGATKDFLFQLLLKGTDAVVRAMATFNGPQFTGEQRPFVNASLAATLSRVPGVAAAEGSAYGYTNALPTEAAPWPYAITGAHRFADIIVHSLFCRVQ